MATFSRSSFPSGKLSFSASFTPLTPRKKYYCNIFFRFAGWRFSPQLLSSSTFPLLGHPIGLLRIHHDHLKHFLVLLNKIILPLYRFQMNASSWWLPTSPRLYATYNNLRTKQFLTHDVQRFLDLIHRFNVIAFED